MANKHDIIAKVSEHLGVSKGEADKALDAVLAAFEDTLKGGDEIRLVGFGTFSVKEVAAHEGRNPATGGTIQIAAKTKVGFKAGKGLTESVNDKK